MPSKALLEALRLALDIAGERREPISRRDIAETVYSQHREQLFSLEDQRSAFMAHLISLATQMMREPLTDEELNRIRLPRQYHATFQEIPQWICVGGSGHKKSIHATSEDWMANSRLKHAIAAQIVVHANIALDISGLLKAEGVESLADLAAKQVAA
jgi:hypothetical protein